MNESKAKQHFLRIPDGHTHPLQRPSDSYTDRVFRKMVEDANKHGDCIINVGRGYYRPLPGDAVDEKEFNEYMKRDLSRVREILLKRKMRSAFEKRSKTNAEQDNKRIHSYKR